MCDDTDIYTPMTCDAGLNENPEHDWPEAHIRCWNQWYSYPGTMIPILGKNFSSIPALDAISGVVCARMAKREGMVKEPKFVPGGRIMRKFHVYKYLILHWHVSSIDPGNSCNMIEFFMSTNTYDMQVYKGDTGFDGFVKLRKMLKPFLSGRVVQEEFAKKEQELRTGTDFVVDIDIPNGLTHDGQPYAPPSRWSFEKGREIALGVFDELIACGVTFEVRWSGCGYHFHAPGAQFYGEFDMDRMSEYLDLYRGIAGRLRDKYGSYIDTSIYDRRRVIKVPYTLAWYNYGRDAFVVGPLFSRHELATFEPDDFRPSPIWVERAWIESCARYFRGHPVSGTGRSEIFGQYGPDTTGTFNMDEPIDLERLKNIR